MGSCAEKGAAAGISISEACGGGCPPRPPMKQRFLVDRITIASRASAGDDVVVRLGGGNVPLVNAAGQHAHVTDIIVDGTRRFTLVDASTGAVSRRLMLRAGFENIFLEDVSGHQYMAGLHGGNIWDHHYARYGAVDPLMVSFVEPIAANAGAGDVDSRLFLHIQLAHQDKRGGGTIPFQGAVPLALFKARENAFRFRVPTAIPTAPTDVTLGAYQGTFLKAWIEVVYLDKVWNAPPFNVESYTEDETSGSLRHGDRAHEFAALRFDEEDTAGQPIDDYTGANSATVGGATVLDGLSLDEWEDRDTQAILSDPCLATLQTTTNLFDNFPFLTGGVPEILFIVPPQRHPDAWPAGRIGYNFTARTQHDTNRILHRTVLCHDVRREVMLAALTGCDPAQVRSIGIAANGMTEQAHGLNTHMLTKTST